MLRSERKKEVSTRKFDENDFSRRRKRYRSKIADESFQNPHRARIPCRSNPTIYCSTVGLYNKGDSFPETLPRFHFLPCISSFVIMCTYVCITIEKIHTWSFIRQLKEGAVSNLRAFTTRYLIKKLMYRNLFPLRIELTERENYY